MFSKAKRLINQIDYGAIFAFVCFMVLITTAVSSKAETVTDRFSREMFTDLETRAVDIRRVGGVELVSIGAECLQSRDLEAGNGSLYMGSGPRSDCRSRAWGIMLTDVVARTSVIMGKKEKWVKHDNIFFETLIPGNDPTSAQILKRALESSLSEVLRGNRGNDELVNGEVTARIVNQITRRVEDSEYPVITITGGGERPLSFYTQDSSDEGTGVFVGSLGLQLSYSDVQVVRYKETKIPGIKLTAPLPESIDTISNSFDTDLGFERVKEAYYSKATTEVDAYQFVNILNLILNPR